MKAKQSKFKETGYKLTGKQIEGYREVEAHIPIRDRDILLPVELGAMGGGTTNFVEYLTEGANYLQLPFGSLDSYKLHKIKACEIGAWLFKKHSIQYPSCVDRKYTLWRKRKKIIKHDWQLKPLPLP